MINKYICIGWGLLLISLWGCQASQATREKDQQAKAYIEQAQAYESQGNLVEALEQYNLAQTIDPNEPVIIDGINRLGKQLDELADTHYQAGLNFRDKGQWDLAKKEFLQALRYRPEHQKAAAMLQQRQPDEDRKYVTHDIAPGDSVSKLALKYYGDYKKYHHIANFNNLSDATQVRVGQRIMIPVIDGTTIDDLLRISSGTQAQPPKMEGEYTLHQIQPGESLSKVAQIYYGDYQLFHVIAAYNGISDPTSIKVGQQVKVPRLEKTSSRTAAPAQATATPYLPGPAKLKPAVKRPEPSPSQVGASHADAAEPADQVAEYRETGIALFNENKFEEATVELQKVLSADPEDTVATGYISRAYVELGRGHLTANRFNEAKTAFTTALDYDDNCRECRDLLARCRTSEAENLKKEGETHYQNNQFDNAISTLERAVALNPKDTTATDLLFQAHFQKALILFNQHDYLTAKTAFGKAAALKPDCSECIQYINNSIEAYKEFHYNQGIVFFGQEELKKAIASWENVMAVDPNYKDVQQNLEKATLLNDRLERIKKSTAE